MNPQSSFTQQHHHFKMNNTTEELSAMDLEYKLLKRKIKQLQEVKKKVISINSLSMSLLTHKNRQISC